MKPHEALRQFWSATGLKAIGAPASQSEVEALETRFAVRLPDDFRDYLLKAMPRAGLPIDKNLTTWWEVSRIASEQTMNGEALIVDGDPANPHRYLLFADHMIWAWAWAIACGETDQRGNIMEIGDRNRIVADNFATFVALNIADDDALF